MVARGRFFQSETAILASIACSCFRLVFSSRMPRWAPPQRCSCTSAPLPHHFRTRFDFHPAICLRDTLDQPSRFSLRAFRSRVGARRAYRSRG